jgi:DNA-binding response OmpR family regulator
MISAQSMAVYPGIRLPVLNASAIRWNAQRRLIVVGQSVIGLTPLEYRLLYPLRHGEPITYASLARTAYHYAVDDNVRMMMDKHIDNIRRKIGEVGLYVYCVLNYGYILLPILTA